MQPSPRLPGRADYGRGRGRIRPAGGRYMAQRSAAEYIDSQPIQYYNESPYVYAADTYAPSPVPVANGHYEHNIGQQLGLQQQPQNFGMSVGNGFGQSLAASVGLGHVGDTRGVPLQYQQVSSLACFDLIYVFHLELCVGHCLYRKSWC